MKKRRKKMKNNFNNIVILALSLFFILIIIDTYDNHINNNIYPTKSSLVSKEQFYNLDNEALYEINIDKKIISNNSILKPSTVDIGEINDFVFQQGKYYFVEVVGTVKTNKMRCSLDMYTYINDERNEDFFLGVNSAYNIIKINNKYDKIKLILSYYGEGIIKIDKIKIFEVNEFYDDYVGFDYNKQTRDVDFNLLSGLLSFKLYNNDTVNEKKIIKNIKNKIMVIDRDYTEVDFSNGIVWDNSKINNRTYLLSLHGFRGFAIYAELFQKYSDENILKEYYTLIDSWINNNKYRSNEDNVAYNDMAIASRVYNWLFFYDIAQDYITTEQKQKIINSLYYQVYLLRELQNYTIGTNHGLYQDISYLFFHYYFSNTENNYYTEVDKAFENIEYYFNTVISNKGVHLEHSPSYHFIMAELLSSVIPIFDSINLNTSELNNKYSKMSEFATYVLKPDGVLPQIGDTDRSEISSNYFNDNKEFLYATSNCQKGLAPLATDVVYSDGGYAIFRDDWSKCEKATYVLFYNHYSSYYHKHSDELGLWIYKNGDIIREAGKGGYNYTDPFVKYAYSSWGHNTLIVNDVGLVENRNIPNDYNYDGTYIGSYSIENPSNVWVEGINKRYKDVTHNRKVNYDKVNNNIKVTDLVTSTKTNKYTLLWHLAPNITPLVKGKNIKLYRDGLNIMDVKFDSKNNYSIDIINGQVHSKIIGWYFDSAFNPKKTNTIRVDFKDVKNIEFITEFQFVN